MDVQWGWARAGVLGCMLLLGGAGSGTAQGQSSLSGGLIWAADMMPPSKIRVSDPDTGMIVYDYQVSSGRQGACAGTATCLLTGVSYVNHEDEDFFDVALKVSNSDDGAYSAIQRVKANPDSDVVFELRNLDFSSVPNAPAYCIQDADDPCGPVTDERCRMHFAEGIDVIHDDPSAETMTVVVADAEGDRVLQATLDYAGGNTCAQVDWVMGEPDVHWPGSGAGTSWPNSVKHIDLGPDGIYLVVSFFYSGEGGSQMHTYKEVDGEWELVWRFPEEGTSVRPYLNTPHMAEVLENPRTGNMEVWFSHSRGAADAWFADYRGYGATWTALQVNGSLSEYPNYLWDMGIWNRRGEAEVMFTRDQDYLADGTMLLADAGCQNVCPYRGALYHVDPRFAPSEPSGLTGAYVPDFSEQSFIEVPNNARLGSYQCGYGSLFEAGYIPGEGLGESLRDAKVQPIAACPPEPRGAR